MLELLTAAVVHLARADVPEQIAPPSGLRGIATGDVFRRLVSRLLARVYAEVLMGLPPASRPVGTDSLAAMLRAVVELDPTATVVSLDGCSACDCFRRAAILFKLPDVARPMLPFARMVYAR